MSECVQRLRHTLAAIADVEAQLLQSTLMQLHGTSLPLGRCLAARILYDYSFSHRRVLLEYSHQVSMTSACGNNGGATATESLHEKTPGVRNPCSFRMAYTDAGGLRLK